MTEPRPLATPRDLWSAVDRLTNPTTRRLIRDDGHTERIQLPSLYDQLVEAIESGTEGSTSRSIPGSRPPMDTAALSLLIEIAEHIRDGCWHRRIKRKHNNDLDLRALVSAINTEGDPNRIDACTTKILTWCAQINATISNNPDRTWRMHSAACRICSSTTVPVFDDDGAETRQPALIVHSADGRIDKITCAFCGSTLTGPDLIDLIRDTRTAIERHAV